MYPDASPTATLRFKSFDLTFKPSHLIRTAGTTAVRQLEPPPPRCPQLAILHIHPEAGTTAVHRLAGFDRTVDLNID